MAPILLPIFNPFTISHQVGTEWRSPFNPCVINECVRVNNEVFVQQKNLSCSQMDVPDCPEGTELRCDQIIDCCPSCRCGKVLCTTNGIENESSHVLVSCFSTAISEVCVMQVWYYFVDLQYNLDIEYNSTCCYYFLFAADVHCLLLNYLAWNLFCIASERHTRLCVYSSSLHY